MKIVIIGGVAGGATAAARIRRLDEKAQIIIFERGKYISYANCGLPYYIGETIENRENILLQSPASFYSRYRVDVRTETEVTSIDPEAREVSATDFSSGRTYRETYDKLLLTPGAMALIPDLPGIESSRVFKLRTVPDSDRIKEFIDKTRPRKAVIIGAGYIGLETAENLKNLGIFVTIVEMAPQVISPLDFEMAAIVHQHLKTKNVEFYLGEKVVALEETSGGITLKLKTGKVLKADMVLLAAGIRPESKLATEAGLKTGSFGAIEVDSHLQTSDENIYAAGDAVAIPDPILGDSRVIPLAGPANKQARIAADNIVTGNTKKYAGAAGTAIAKVFDITVGMTGYSDKELRQKNMDFMDTIVHRASHAGYYPGAMPMTIKINFATDTGRLYGAQVIGYKGVDKAVEVLSFVCQHGLTIYDLMEHEHAYAPPFSSAKSPVNIAGFVAENILSGKIKTVSWKRVAESAPEDVFILDARDPEEAELGAIKNAVNIPLDTLRERLDEIPKDRNIYVYCAVGQRSYLACRILMQNGFSKVYNISGGYKTWEHATLKQSNEDIYEKYVISKDDAIYKTVPETPDAGNIYTEIDGRGLQCPGPIIKLNREISKVADGKTVKMTATDPGFENDIAAWTRTTGNTLLNLDRNGDTITALIRKDHSEDSPSQGSNTALSKNKTIIVFSDSLDRALASFVIANGALAAGKKVSMFFTFWGLNILKKNRRKRMKKDIISRAFSFMLPGGSAQLKLSRMNMLGIGSRLMKWLMRRKNIETLEELIQSAVSGGAELTACQMSMDLMGINKEELINGVKIGGVASYIESSDSAGTNLFI